MLSTPGSGTCSGRLDQGQAFIPAHICASYWLSFTQKNATPTPTSCLSQYASGEDPYKGGVCWYPVQRTHALLPGLSILIDGRSSIFVLKAPCTCYCEASLEVIMPCWQVPCESHATLLITTTHVAVAVRTLFLFPTRSTSALHRQVSFFECSCDSPPTNLNSPQSTSPTAMTVYDSDAAALEAAGKKQVLKVGVDGEGS